jgi:hypothetical protein
MCYGKLTGTCRATLVTFAWDGGTPTRALSCGNHTGGATAYASIVFHDAGPHTATATVGGQIRTASFTVADAAIVVTARALTLVAGVNSVTFVATAADANQYWTCAQYTTTVDWGDGSTTPATCQVPPLGGASFGASHAYASPGNYTHDRDARRPWRRNRHGQRSSHRLRERLALGGADRHVTAQSVLRGAGGRLNSGGCGKSSRVGDTDRQRFLLRGADAIGHRSA